MCSGIRIWLLHLGGPEAILVGRVGFTWTKFSAVSYSFLNSILRNINVDKWFFLSLCWLELRGAATLLTTSIREQDAM